MTPYCLPTVTLSPTIVGSTFPLRLDLATCTRVLSCILVPHPMLMLFTSPVHKENLHNCKQTQQEQPHNCKQSHKVDHMDMELTRKFLLYVLSSLKDNPNIKHKTQNKCWASIWSRIIYDLIRCSLSSSRNWLVKSWA